MTLSSYWVQVTVPRDEGASDEPNRLIELARSTLGDKEALQNVVKCPEDFSASVDSEVARVMFEPPQVHHWAIAVTTFWPSLHT